MWAQSLVRPFRFELQDVAAPSERDLNNGEIIIRTLAGGICGSDLPYFLGVPSRVPRPEGQFASNVPGIPLHEIVGEVLTSTDSDFEIGQRVVGWANRNNGLAERIITKAASLIPISSHEAPGNQVIHQALACVIYAVEQLGDLRGKHVAILGQGPIGLLFSHVAHAAGAARVIGVDRIDRSDVAQTFGIDEVVPSSSDRWARSLNPDEQPDIVIDAIGHQAGTLNHAIEAAGFGGLIYYFGIADDPVYAIDIQRLQRKNLTLASGTTPPDSHQRSLLQASQYLAEHNELLSAYATNIFHADDVQSAFDCAIAPAPGRLKVIIAMS